MNTDQIIRELVLYNGMTLSEAHQYISNAIDDYSQQKMNLILVMTFGLIYGLVVDYVTVIMTVMLIIKVRR